MNYVVSAFSPKMLRAKKVSVVFMRKKLEEVKKSIDGDWSFRLGHQGAVDLVKQIFGVDIAINRDPIQLSKGDLLLVIMPNRRLEPGEELTKEELESDVTYYYMYVGDVLDIIDSPIYKNQK